MRALISLSDKTGLVDLAQGLVANGYEIYTTGGTRKTLDDAGIPARSVSELTGFPEILDGRVKTLHPAVYGGILARRDLAGHMAEIKKNGIEPIDLVAVNLYPFIKTANKDGVTLEEAIENIDIGGPTLIRAAAKNFKDVVIIVDPADYQPVLEKITNRSCDLETRKKLAAKAFQHVAVYDTAIAQYLRDKDDIFPEELTVAMRKRFGLRYGENPHQRSAFYAEVRVANQKQASGITNAAVLHGKELSFNNILDADSAWQTATDFNAPTVAIIKHTNPCGLATHEDLAEAYRRALSGDPIAAYGGIVASNRTLTLAVAQEMRTTFYEMIIAPGYEPDALELLQKKRDLRIIRAEIPPDYGKTPRQGFVDFRHVRGGFLVGDGDTLSENEVQLKVVTQRKPSPEEVADMLFAWQAAKWVKSNAIVLAKDRTLLGMGAGQPSRIISVQIARERAGARAKGSVMASDAMFPFSDSVEAAAAAGVTAIVQPGGSIRDGDSIKAADKYNLAMVFTGIRHFRH